MDKQNSNQKYTGRFGDGNASAQPKVNPISSKAAPNGDNARRPSGFGSAAQPARRKPAAQQASSTAEAGKNAAKSPKQKNKKEKKQRPIREKKPRSGLKILIIAIVVLLAALFAIVLIFGGNQIHHQMPIIEREVEASFAPEHTPMPGMEVS